MCLYWAVGVVNIGKRQTWNKKCTTRVTRDSDSTGVVYFQEEVHCYFNNLNQVLICEDTSFYVIMYVYMDTKTTRTRRRVKSLPVVTKKVVSKPVTDRSESHTSSGFNCSP